MATNRVDELFDIAAIDAQKAKIAAMLNDIKGNLDDLQKLGKSIQIGGSIGGSESNTQKAAKAIDELSFNIQEYNKLLKQNEALQAKMNLLTSDAAQENIKLSKAYKDLKADLDGSAAAKAAEAKATKDAADAKRLDAQMRQIEIAGAKEAVAIQKELEKQKKALEAATKQEAKEQAIAAKNVFDLANAYDVLNAKHKAAIKEYQNAAAAGKLSANEITALKDRANDLGQQLFKIDTAVGNYRRNVGNYSSAWNGLGNSINQIAREMPNFAQSFQLGILAISNNLPILQDEIVNTKKRIAELKAEGKAAPSLFSQITASILSWQTALTVGITILVAYSKEIGELFESLFNSSSKAELAQKALNEAYKNSNYDDVIAQVNQLTTEFKLAKDGLIDKDAVLKKYNETIGQTIGQTNDINEAERLTIENAPKLIEFTKLKAIATYAYEQSAKLLVESIIDERKETEALGKAMGNMAVGGGSAMFALNKAEEFFYGKRAQRRKMDSDDFKKIADENLRNAAKLFDINTIIDTGEKAGKSPRVEKVKEENQQILDDFVDIYKQITDRLNDFEEDELDVRSRSLAYLRSQLEAGVISVAFYEKQKQAIIKNSEEDILKSQFKFLTETLNSIGLSQENTNKVVELWQKKRIDLKKKETDAEEAELMEREKIRSDFDKQNAERERERIAIQKRRDREANQLRRELAQETANFIFTLLDAQTQKEIESLEKQKEAISDRYDQEREAIDAAFLADEEKAARKKVLDAEEAERQKLIDAEIRQKKRQAAILEKAQAIATIAINAALAKAAAFAPPPVGLGPVAGATLLPLILGLAAAQTAAVIATPIPEYAKGKKETDSYEGLAIAGEKGTELMIDKDGKLSLLTQPTLINTKRGDRIFSNQELRQGVANERIAEAQVYDNTEVVRALGYGFGSLNSTIKNKKPDTIILDQTRYYDLQRAARR